MEKWTPETDKQITAGHYEPVGYYRFPYGEVARHLAAHEIHHIGQLSVRSRELGREPVSANLIFRGLYEEN
ncbi:hypothetical protein F3157_20700 [Virgibacillus dakarensis]|nr:hypothetical protein [Virgibacillus dakarensis]